MDLEIIILSEVNQKRQILYDIIYMWNLKNNTNELFTKQKQTHKHRKQSCGYQRVRGEREISSMGLTDTRHYV